MRLELCEASAEIVRKELSNFVGSDMSELLTQDENGNWGIDWDLRNVDDYLLIEQVNDFIVMTKIYSDKEFMDKLSKAGKAGAKAGTKIRDEMLKPKQKITRIRRVKA